MLRPTSALALLLLVPAASEGPRFAPAEGSELTKRFEVSFEAEIEELSIKMGQTTLDDYFDDVDLTLSTDLAVDVTDTFRRVADGRPVELIRRFDGIESRTKLDYVANTVSGEVELELASDLDGRRVRFLEDAEDEDDRIELLDADETDGDLVVQGLVEDMDLRALLPDNDVERGDSWKVDPSELGTLLLPGGSLHLRPVDDEDDTLELFQSLAGIPPAELAESELEGWITCTYMGTRERDGIELARIEIDFDVDGRVDLEPLLLRVLDDLWSGSNYALSDAALSIDLTGTGELDWNVEAGHFQAFEARLDTWASFELNASGGDGSLEVRAAGSGTATVEAEAGA
ncbi:MAG: hypothetical protein AAF682_24330 [Planctomycetota bacterium]